MDGLAIPANHVAANRYRDRAELIRGTAGDTAGPAVRQQLLQIAEGYEWLAKAVETGAVRLILTSGRVGCP
jgi:hypothetical protein